MDQVYEYQGDLDADGEEEVGKVNFFRDRVVSFRIAILITIHVNNFDAKLRY